MIDREATLKSLIAVLEGKKPERVVWQPRLKHWYDVNNVRNTVPERYQGKYLDEIYEDLKATPRQVWQGGIFGGGEFAGYPGIVAKEGEDVDVWVKQTKGLYYMTAPGDYIITKYVTPVGEMSSVLKRTEYGTSRYPVEYFLKDRESIKVYKYVLERRTYQFDWQRYRWGEKRFGDLIYPRGSLSKEPLMRLTIELMGVERAVKWLWRYPKEMEDLMELMTQDIEKQIECYAKTPVVELCFGSNMHQDLCSPRLFKKYLIPFYERVIPKIHKAGKYATAHWDGYVEKLLPLVKETGLDGLECVTPKPQGDVTLEEMKRHIIDEGMFLRDGIPAVLFLPWTPIEKLKEFTFKVLDTLGSTGRLILGISDMLPANADIERVRLVGKLVEEWNEKNF